MEEGEEDNNLLEAGENTGGTDKSVELTLEVITLLGKRMVTQIGMILSTEVAERACGQVVQARHDRRATIFGLWIKA